MEDKEERRGIVCNMKLGVEHNVFPCLLAMFVSLPSFHLCSSISSVFVWQGQT